MKHLVKMFSFATACLVAASPALAQQASAAGQETSISGGALALIAYGVLWVLLFGLIFMTVRRQRGLDREIDALEGRIDEVFDDLA